MLNLITVGETSPFLSDVQDLWGKNRQFLGPFPKGAFIDRARAEQIIGAVLDDKLVGYLLYFVSKTRRRAQITHLCVDEKQRSAGVAKRLVKDLVVRTRHLNGVGLHCRRDFPAHSMWPKLGFAALSTKLGRTGKFELTRFYMGHPHPGLFDNVEDARVDVVIDANVFFDLGDHTGNDADESQGLEADWLTPLIRLCYTQELLNEINKHSDETVRSDNHRRCAYLHRLDTPAEDFYGVEDEIGQLLGAARSEQDKADRRHLAWAVVGGATVFVTRDAALLSISDQIYEHHGIEILRPADLIGRFGELQNQQAFQRDRLRGTTVTTRRLSGDIDELVNHFHDSEIEKRSALEKQVRTAVADPTRMEVHVVSKEGNAIALYVVDRRRQPLVSVPVFRISRSVQSPRFRNSLTRTLLTEITARAPSNASIVVSDVASEELLDYADAVGFRSIGKVRSKVKLSGEVTARDAAQRIRDHAAHHELAPELIQLATDLDTPEFQSDSHSAAHAEHILWPLKIRSGSLPCFIVPIQPHWATHLFDGKLAKNTLEGADKQLAFNSEFVYYRSVSPNVLRAPARILWYVSQGVLGSKQIRAVSRLNEIVVGTKRDVFLANRNFGVYGWKDVEKASKGEEVMALRCSDTELCQKPFSWKNLQPILAAEGVRNNLVGPSKISEDGFFQIYRLAFPSQ